jgi:multidrug efflux pump subunit AcrA (membrane-fusion protein)
MNSRRTRKPPRPWYLILIGIATAAIIVAGIAELGVASGSSARTSSEVVTAADGVVQTTESGSGEVEPGVDEFVNFGTSGTLKSVDVKVGQHVNKGQLLATLDPTSANIAVEQDQASVLEAKENLKNAEDGDSSTSDSDSSASDSSSSASAGDDSSDDTSASVGEQNSTAEFVSDDTKTATTTTTTSTTPTTTTTGTPGTGKHGKGGTGTGTTSTGKNGTGSTAANGDEGNSGDSHRSGESSNTGTSSSSANGSDSSTAGTSSGTTKTKPSKATILSDKAALASANATLASAKQALKDTKLYAPASGKIASLEDTSAGATISSGSDSSASSSSSSGSSTSASTASTGEEGNSSGSGDSSSSDSGFAEIVNSHHMTMTVELSEDDISSVHDGQVATVSITALNGVKLAGKVTAIDPLGTESDDVVEYDATITIYQDNPKVLAGMSATAEIVTDQASGVTIPSEAVTGSGSSATVDLDTNGKTKTTPVVVGLKGADRDQIISGLKSGQQVRVTITLPSLGTTTSSSSTSASSGSRFGGFGSGAAGGGFAARAAAGGFGGGGFGGGGAP